MASGNDLIFGQIGAAKIFCGNLSASLEVSSSTNRKEMERLEEQMDQTTDEKQLARLSKKQQKLRNRQAKIQKNQDKANNAVDFLGRLAERVDLGKDEIIDFLSNFIVVTLPPLEVALKTALLANIKKMTSCAINASIPDSLRDKGMLINEAEIDPRHILLMPPISKYGHYQYFGVDKPNMSSYEFTRAEDMNAFIWFVKNCAKFTNALSLNGHPEEYFALNRNESGDNFVLHEGTYKASSNDTKQLVIGTVLIDVTTSNTFYIVDNIFHNEEGDKFYSVKSVGNKDNFNSVATSVNWFAKSKPLFSLAYSNSYNSSARLPINNYKFKILQKPFMIGSTVVAEVGNAVNDAVDGVYVTGKELLSGNKLTDEGLKEKLSKYKNPIIGNPLPRKALFDYDGKYNPKGKYTINTNRFTIINRGCSNQTWDTANNDSDIIYELISKDGSGVHGYLRYDKMHDQFSICSDGYGLQPIKGRWISQYLIECYKGTTVYEFNHDYVMSFKLFDAKVVTANVINTLLGVELPISPETIMKSLLGKKEQTADSYNQVYLRTMIDMMVQKMLDTETDEFESCFYTFSNEEYVEMEEQTAMKVINGHLLKEETVSGLTSAFDILKAYDADASLHEQTEIITRTLTKALENIGVDDDSNLASPDAQKINGGSTINGDSSFALSTFVKRAMRALITELTYTLLSPKVLMLIAVNKKLMHDEAIENDEEKYQFSYQDVIGGLQGVIMSVVKEVIDAVEKELLRVILARITEIMNGYTKALAKEYLESWRTLLKSLLSCFSFGSKRMRAGYYDDDTDNSISEALNRVDYADLDELAGQIIPDTNPCN